MRPRHRPPDPRARQDGSALQVLWPGDYLLTHGQTVQQRTVTLALLRHEKDRVRTAQLTSDKVQARQN